VPSVTPVRATQNAALDGDDWHHASWCEGWTVIDVAAHLASVLGASLPRLGMRMARAGFFPPMANKQDVRRWSRRGAPAIVDALAEERPLAVASVYAKVGLTEAVVHHQDMRRALGRPRPIAEARLVVALDVVAKRPGTGTGGRRRRRGLRLRATDVDWCLGDGPEVSGPAEALLMTLAGRRAAMSDLSGEGKALLARR
jgi:uncharacterized protein (TIGR03083 family)